MTVLEKQKTCPACGKPFVKGQATDVEALIDPSIRYIVRHSSCSTFKH